MNYIKNSIEVSVIIPVYNTAPWLVECLDSVLKQDYTNIQVICINDGSTDDSAQILKAYTEKDKRIMVIHQKNQGLADARNQGIKRAKGKYLLFLDSDDIMFDGIISELIPKAESDSLEFLRFRQETFYDAGWKGRQKKISHKQFDYPGIWTGPELYSAEKNNHDYDAAVWRTLYLRDYLNTHHLEFRFFPYEDALFTFECYLHAKRAGFLNKSGLRYRIRENSITTSPHDISYVRSRYFTSRVMELLCYEKNQISPDLPDRIFDEPQLRFRKAVEDYQKHRNQISSQAVGKSDEIMLRELDQYLELQELREMEKKYREDLSNRDEAINLLQTQMGAIYNSKSWKLVSILIRPFHLIKKLINNKY